MAPETEYFEPSHLLVHEVNYELRLRNLNTRCGEAVKRSALKRCLEQDRVRRIEYELADFDFDEEKEEIYFSLETLRVAIATLSVSRHEVVSKLRSRFVHLKARVKRLPSLHNNPFFRADTLVKILALEEELGEKLNSSSELVSHSEPEPRIPTTVTTHIPTSTINIPATASTSTTVFMKTTPVYKWDLSFNGDGDKLLDFLERVKELQVSRNVSSEFCLPA